VKTENKQAKGKMLNKIKNFSSAIAVGTTSMDKFTDLLEKIQVVNKGILFLGKETFIDTNGKILFDCNGYSDHDNESKISESQERRKLCSEKALNERNIVVNDILPVFPDEKSVKLKSIREIGKRAAALTITVLKGEGVTNGNLEEFRKKFDLNDSFFSQ